MARRVRLAGLVRGAALVLCLGGGPAVTAPPIAASAAPATCASLPLVWVDNGHAAPHVLAEASREATRIWADAGVALQWSRQTPGRPVRPDAVLVMVRARLAGGNPADHHVRRRATLGRVIRVSEDRPTRLIEVALPAVVAAVLNEMAFGRPLRELPAVAREAVIGRALGRVAAHEIGHWLFGREHAPEGLMRASIRRADLVSLEPPALPDGWPATAGDRLLVRRGCAPDPTRQPVTD